MNKNQPAWILPLAGTLFLATASARANESAAAERTNRPAAAAGVDETAASARPDESVVLERVYLDSANRLTASVRFGLHIPGKFFSPGGSLNPNAAPGNGQRTPHGDLYNYDDGYVLPGLTGGTGLTRYWGYNNPSQLNASGADSIDFHHTTGDSLPGSNSANDSHVGCELTYDYELGVSHYGLEDEDGWNHFRFGIEGAANFMPINFNSGGSYNTTLSTTTTTYGYEPGTQPPQAPYQGPFSGPGFLLNSSPSGPSVTSPAGAATVTVHQDFDSTLWGFRLGPYLESPVTEHFFMHVTGGLAVGILSASANWNETISASPGSSLPSGVPTSSSGSGDDTSVLWGYYFGADANYRFDKHWGIDLGVQYQHLENYNHDFGGRMAELDLGHSLFLQAGISFSF